MNRVLLQRILQMSKYSDGYYVLTKHSGIDQPYHWVLKAPNHEVILTSENYSSKHAALNGIESVQENCNLDKNYSKKTASDGSPYFTLHAKNSLVIGTSEMYSSNEARDNGIEAVKKYGITTIIVDETNTSGGNNGNTSGAAVISSKPVKNENAGRYA